MGEWFEIGLRILFWTGVILTSWSVTSSLGRIAVALEKSQSEK